MIRKAEYTDIGRALDIYDSARRFMRSRGNAVQWVNGYPSEELLRADTHEANRPMRRCLERAGFVYTGVITVADGTPRRAYERV